METRILGKSGLPVSALGFGALTLGPSQLNLPLSEGAALLRYALDLGINFIDTAQYYKTYPYIRHALKGVKKDVVIVSKCLDESYRAMLLAVEEARRELDRDVIDIFLLHEVRGGSDWENRKGAYEYLKEAKAKGLVKAIGVSTHHVDVAERAAADPDADVLFPLINLRGLGVRKGSGAGTREEMEAAILRARSAGQGVFAMKVLGGGILIREYREAMQYAMDLPGISSIMLGFGSVHEIDRAVEMAERRLASDYVPDLTQKRIFIDRGDCEGCGACSIRCPNQAIHMDEKGLAVIDYERCLTCAYCAPVCPVRAIIMLG